jgi:hypothetical protein
MQISAVEAQYIEARKLNREETVAAYDMPPPAVHILDPATYSNLTEQLRSIYRDTMAPITVFLESELETQLRGSVRPGRSEPDFGDDVYAEFLLDGVLRGDFEQRAAAYQMMITSGWGTPAEVRKLENMPFIPGSDQLYMHTAMAPLNQAATPALDPTTLSIVMGRLGRQKTVDDIDAGWLVEGLNGHADIVTRALAAARAAGDDLDGFKVRIKAL